MSNEDDTRRITPPPKLEVKDEGDCSRGEPAGDYSFSVEPGSDNFKVGKRQGLCFRCEYRAQYFEEGHAPRSECGGIESSKHVCYMYRPVCPVTTVPWDKGDKRPRHGPAMISSREQFKEVARDFRLTLYQDGDSSTLYWVPLQTRARCHLNKLEEIMGQTNDLANQALDTLISLDACVEWKEELE